MSGWAIFGIIVALVIVLLLAMNAKDLRRYFKISHM